MTTETEQTPRVRQQALRRDILLLKSKRETAKHELTAAHAVLSGRKVQLAEQRRQLAELPPPEENSLSKQRHRADTALLNYGVEKLTYEIMEIADATREPDESLASLSAEIDAKAKELREVESEHGVYTEEEFGRVIQELREHR